MPSESIRNSYVQQGFNEHESSLLASMSMQIDAIKDRMDKIKREDGVVELTTEDIIVKLKKNIDKELNA